MKQRKFFVFGSIFVYVVLIVVFLILTDFKPAFDLNCLEKPCLRLCCKIQKCDQKFIDEKLNFTSFPSGKGSIIEYKKIQGYFGKPDCNLMPLKDDEDWEILFVR